MSTAPLKMKSVSGRNNEVNQRGVAVKGIQRIKKQGLNLIHFPDRID